MNDRIKRTRNTTNKTFAKVAAIPAMPTLHPAYLLRTPAHKRLAWRDFIEVKMKLRSLQG